MNKKALITGISGQDGSYLAELLLDLQYEVFGFVKAKDLENPTLTLRNIAHLLDRVKLYSVDFNNFQDISQKIERIKPLEVYHFAASSFVSFSFEDEFSIMEMNSRGTHYLISAIYKIVPECKFYFAGSSEMFGDVLSSPQDENTIFRPRTIYGISKVVGHELIRNYREKRNMFACSGILYNHESPRRAEEFVTRKITRSAAKIKLKMAQKIELGNIDALRDWGFAKDYVEAIYRMMQLPNPQDFVIGTGTLHSVREFLEIAFGELGLDYQKYLEINPVYIRPCEKIQLVANPQKANKILDWKPKVSFSELVKMMVRRDFQDLNSGIQES